MSTLAKNHEAPQLPAPVRRDLIWPPLDEERGHQILAVPADEISAAPNDHMDVNRPPVSSNEDSASPGPGIRFAP